MFILLRTITPNLAFSSFFNEVRASNVSIPGAIQTIQKIGNFADRLNNKLQTLMPLLREVQEQSGAQSRSGSGGTYSDWLGYNDGYEMSSKSDYSWLVPIVIVIGLGTLVIPLLGTFMTSMLTQGTINLTAGRRRRSVPQDQR